MSQIIKSLVRTTVRLTARGLRSGPHITRYAMYEALRRYAPVVRNDGRTLAVSHSRPLCEVLGIAPASVLEANYPECDLLSLPFEDGTFANVVTDQVLEHVNDPRTAIAESVRAGAWRRCNSYDLFHQSDPRCTSGLLAFHARGAPPALSRL